MDKIRPLKQFGQNYLKDRNILLKIVNEISPKEEDALIEIGPGMGMLTQELYSRTRNMTAVEIDRRVIEELKTEFPTLRLINGDFLKIDLKEIYNEKQKPLRIAGNIPYNITSPIIFKLIENITLVEDAVFMVQYEVARRLSAIQGSEDYGILAVILKYFADVELCFKVSPNVFYPKPKVFSAVVHIRFNNTRTDEPFNKLFRSIVKASFGNRRKTLKNSLNNSIFSGINFEGSGIDLSKRAEQLKVEDFIQLTDFVKGKQQ
ncbi:MAG: 16S rRNA (adenine(1518)-N(6)/adenine(1519)-N(6))-dimethyltransferase RsmA [Bacteroidota bacterium]|jgi:16S rRNA (adenine1518-N6/adenine1519-N6)-dimethyltransferase|nr:ribosomal RNA small subunit methyltransferase A [Ignavibacteria bacterium]MCU7499005.1 ribosomal RNA small subunit methyltransferase A [Ignavibacteria bacterium]MCU7512421.1 ribosomal RNA small subunit methyltransferase A [Ignavibacteria bacterium]MCU7518608.1 ribosomal RNA small subunit methyltransferase A [Ignavibacteria bacterium]MCU7524292.1 ribosomal RNA small subunit methyltransferase A [Ignavibacteria bacterium]